MVGRTRGLRFRQLFTTHVACRLLPSFKSCMPLYCTGTMSSKRNRRPEDEDSAGEEEDSSADSDVDSDGNYVGDNQLEATFEGRNPEDCDYHGIQALLRQLFLKAQINLSQLTQMIISQNYVGSVVKQSLDDEGEVAEDEDDDEGSGGVFGITTILNITKKKEEQCIAELRSLLVTLADENADESTRALVKQILNDDANHVGLLINERIMNIPAAISVPLFRSLQTELERAIRKGMPYNFKYIAWISKIYVGNDASSIKDRDDLVYANSEEEDLIGEAVASFDVDVAAQVDSSQWEFDGIAMKPFRKVLIFEAKKLNHLIETIEQHVLELKAAAGQT